MDVTDKNEIGYYQNWKFMKHFIDPYQQLQQWKTSQIKITIDPWKDEFIKKFNEKLCEKRNPIIFVYPSIVEILWGGDLFIWLEENHSITLNFCEKQNDRKNEKLETTTFNYLNGEEIENFFKVLSKLF